MKEYRKVGYECLAVRTLFLRRDLVGDWIFVVELVRKSLVRIAHDVMVEECLVVGGLVNAAVGVVALVMALAELVKEAPIVLATRPSKHDERSL